MYTFCILGRDPGKLSSQTSGSHHLLKSAKQAFGQNRNRDMEIKNKLTVTRGEGEGGQWRKEGEKSRNTNKGPV